MNSPVVPQRIAVTGAAGFIGSHLTQSLAQLGHSILAIDCLLDASYSSDLKRQNWALLNDLPKVIKVEMDLRQDELGELLRGAEIVYHLAAMPGLMKSWTDFKLYQDSNLLATSNLLKGLDSTSLKMLINVSTSSVYGLNAVGNETMPTNPISPYGVTKLAAENLVRAYCDAMSLPFNIVRPFSVYGPRQRPDMAFNILIRKINENDSIDIFGDGHASRSNTYVSDLVDGLLKLGESDNIGETYNLCGTENLSIIEVVRLIEEIVGKTAQISYKPERLGDQLRTFGSSKKAEEHFGFIAKMNFRDGIRRQAEWQLR